MPNFVYSDVDSKLTITPDGNVKILYDEDAIIQSVKNILATIAGERVRNPIGSSLVRFIAEPLDDDNAFDIRRLITEALVRYEPRVRIVSASVVPLHDVNMYDINLILEVVEMGRRIPFRTRLRSFGE